MSDSSKSRLNRPLRRLLRSWAAVAGAILVVFFVLIALTADWVAPYTPDAVAEAISSPPSWSHWLGTDQLGKDVFSRVLHGSRLSLAAALAAVTLALALGLPIGVIAGYCGGTADSLLMRAIDIALAFPSVLIAMLAAAAFQPGWLTVIVAVGLINVPVFARQSRATVLVVRNLDYVLAAQALGAGHWRIIWRCILPALVSPICVLGSLSVGSAILEVAGLSFLGLGGDITAPEWGGMLALAKNHWSKNIGYALGPGLAISLTVLGFNLLGDGVRDALDPRSDSSALD